MHPIRRSIPRLALVLLLAATIPGRPVARAEEAADLATLLEPIRAEHDLTELGAVRGRLRRDAAGRPPAPFPTPETRARITRPVGGGTYALGWGTGERAWGGGRVLTHAGSNTLWYCVAWVAPEKGFAVLVTTNQAGPDAVKGTGEAASALIRWLRHR